MKVSLTFWGIIATLCSSPLYADAVHDQYEQHLAAFAKTLHSEPRDVSIMPTKGNNNTFVAHSSINGFKNADMVTFKNGKITQIERAISYPNSRIYVTASVQFNDTSIKSTYSIQNAAFDQLNCSSTTDYLKHSCQQSVTNYEVDEVTAKQFDLRFAIDRTLPTNRLDVTIKLQDFNALDVRGETLTASLPVAYKVEELRRLLVFGGSYKEAFEQFGAQLAMTKVRLRGMNGKITADKVIYKGGADRYGYGKGSLGFTAAAIKWPHGTYQVGSGKIDYQLVEVDTEMPLPERMGQVREVGPVIPKTTPESRLTLTIDLKKHQWQGSAISDVNVTIALDKIMSLGLKRIIDFDSDNNLERFLARMGMAQAMLEFMPGLNGSIVFANVHGQSELDIKSYLSMPRGKVGLIGAGQLKAPKAAFSQVLAELVKLNWVEPITPEKLVALKLLQQDAEHYSSDLQFFGHHITANGQSVKEAFAWQPPASLENVSVQQLTKLAGPRCLQSALTDYATKSELPNDDFQKYPIKLQAAFLFCVAKRQNRPWPAAEAVILQNPFSSYQYASRVLKKPWPKGEASIATEAFASLMYAKFVIRGRWPKGEAIILTDGDRALSYVDYVFDGKRWPEAEKALIGDALFGTRYAKNVLKRRWPEAEPAIMQDAGFAMEYAKHFIKGRWPKAEPYIKKSPFRAKNYAEDVLKARWPEAEPFIMKHPTAAVYYAEDVIKGRWPEAEAVINTDAWQSFRYVRYVLKHRSPALEPDLLKYDNITFKYFSEHRKNIPWPEAEPIFLSKPDWAIAYADTGLKARWPKAEPMILKSEYGYLYAALVMKKRWPELEKIIVNQPEHAMHYADTVLKKPWPEAEPYIKKGPLKNARRYAYRVYGNRAEDWLDILE